MTTNTTAEALQALPSGNDPEAIINSLMPQWGEDSPKTRYLSLRASGFNVREAATLVGVAQRTVVWWRSQDPVFKSWDQERIGEVRQRLGAHFAYAEFLRNFRLVMIDDFKCLWKQATQPDKLTSEDRAKLARIRTYYTPRDIEVVRAALAGGPPGSGLGTTNIQFNFVALVKQMATRMDNGHV